MSQTNVWAAGVVTPAPSPGVDWSGCDLFNANLAGADLTNASLSGANISQASLMNATLQGTNLAGADLFNTNAGNAHIVDANLTTADLEGFGVSSISHSDLAGADISLDSWDAVTLTYIKSGGLTDPNGTATFPRGWKLDHGYLVGPGVDFSGVNFPALGANVPNLTQWNLSNSDFTGANLAGVDLDNDNLTHDQFAGANLTSANLQNDNLAGADLQGATFTGTTLDGVESGQVTGTPAGLPANWSLRGGYLLGPGAGLGSANLAGLNLTGVNLQGANLYLGTLANANLTNANLRGAYLDVVDTTGVTWKNTTCPDGTNSDNDGGTCVNNNDDLPPAAQPTISGPGQNGWYTSATVNWNWYDGNGSIDPARCVTTSTSTTQGKPTTLTAKCYNTVGNMGTASVSVNIEDKGPTVAVTGVKAGRPYAAGHVPAAGCRTTDALSGVLQEATLAVTTSGSHGVGSFTATCAGAVNVAGVAQAAPVRVTYTVAYGLRGFLTPKNKATVLRSSRAVTVTFKLAGIAASQAAKLAAAAASGSRCPVQASPRSR